MAEIDLGFSWTDEENLSLTDRGIASRKRNRRNRIERAKYDAMQKAERQKLALDKLQSDEFQETLKRYYSGGVSDMNNVVTGGKDIKDYTKSELIEKFYQDRIWSEYNTIGIANDVGQVLAKDEQYKGDWAEITQVYADLPYFGNETIGFLKWAKDFVPALIADPINLFSLGAGKIITREAGKTALTELTKQEFVKQTTKKAALEIGIKEAAYGATVTAGADLARQTAEIDVGLMTDYNLSRTLISSTAGGVAQGTIGAGMAAWSAKGKAGRFYDKGDGFKSDYSRDFGFAGSNAEETFSGATGKSKKFKPTTSKKVTKKVTDRTSEVETINTKVNDIKRKTPIINLSKINPDEAHNAVVNELKSTINDLVNKGEIRTTERVGLFNQIKNKAAKLLGKENAEKLDEELKAAAKITPDLAPTIYAGRVNILNKSKEVLEIKELADNAVDLDEKIAVADKLIEALSEKSVLVKNHVDTVQGVSDALNQQKLMVEMTDADKLRMETDIAISNELPTLIENIKKLSPEQKIKAINDIADISNNDYQMRKLIKEVNRKTKKKEVTFFEALNEYTTANLLGDPTTHEINLLSSATRFQANIVEQFVGGLLSLKQGQTRQAINQMQMAGDLLIAQLRFFNIAFKKAKLSWKANRSIGDTLEHRFDGRQQRNMETYFNQLKASDSKIKQWIGTTASPIGKIAFATLRFLGAGDTLMKNIFNRAARVANVNQRMRAFYPELWKKRKLFNKTQIVALEDNIRNTKENIRFEQAQDKVNVKKLEKLNNKLKELEQQKISQTPFEKKWSELYYQYEDEFGNFKSTNTFNPIEAKTLDDLTKSVANDPLYVSRQASFTQNLKNEMLDPTQFYPDQQQSKANLGDWVLKTVNKAPLIRVFTGLHFVKTPVNLFKLGWQMTPVLNKLNMEFRAMLNASDPIVRNKAQAIQGVGMAAYGYATYLAFADRITGHKEKDRKHRFAYKWTDENGVTQYTSLSRFFPLSIPFMVMASIKDSIEDFQDVFSDPLHSAEQERYLDYLRHIAGSSFSLWSNIFASNLMTQDFFKLTQIFSETESTEEEGSASISKLERYFGRSTSKLIPLATSWRWTNKVFADGEAELITMTDHLKQSSPYALSKIINEKYLGGQFPVLNYGDALAPKRDPLGNPYPKTKGLLLGQAQDMFPVSSHWSNSMMDSNGNKIVLSQEAKDKLQQSNIQWERPVFIVNVGLAKPINLKETMIRQVKHPETNETITFKEGTTAYEALLQLKGMFKINDRTLNERFRDELEDPNSQYNSVYGANRLIGGKYEGDQYLLSIIREYEREARDWLKYSGIIEIEGKATTIENLKSKAEQVLMNIYE